MLKFKNLVLFFMITVSSLSVFAMERDVLKKNHDEYRQAGNFTFISSIPPIDPISGQIPEESEDQVRLVFANLYALVKKIGAEMKDIVKVTVYVNNRDTLMPLVDKVMDNYFTKEPFPARTPVATNFGSKPYVVSVDAIVYIEPKAP